MGSELPPSDVAPPPPDGVSATGLPWSQRGGIRLDVAGLLIKGNNRNPIATMNLGVDIPVRDRTFITTSLPFVFGALGNPMLGARHVYRPSDRLWIHASGAFGFPLVNIRNFDTFSMARGLWDMQDLAVKMIPFALKAGVEWHSGIVELRGEIDPVFGVSISEGDSHHFAIQHAIEAQIGHTIGGGLRYQGVGFGTKTNPLDGDDHYQGAFEPFFVVRKNPIFVRLGILLPADKQMGAPFDSTWGMRATMGWNLD